VILDATTGTQRTTLPDQKMYFNANCNWRIS